jgi:hypothetical protein
MDASGQAAWIQAIGSLMAIVAAIFVTYIPIWFDRREKRSISRRALMNVALDLAFAIDEQSGTMDLVTNLIGIAQKNLSIEQGIAIMSVNKKMYVALDKIIESSQYMSEKDCEIVFDFRGYAHNFDWWVARFAFSSQNPETENMQAVCNLAKARQEAMFEKLTDLKKQLGKYLPTWAKRAPPRPSEDNMFVDD